MWHAWPPSWVQRSCALVAAVFGTATILAGGRILLGIGDAGYTVVRPVLLFNTGMGVLYLAAAVLILRNPLRGRLLAAGIALLNVIVLVAIVARRATGGAVADETLVAMTLRSAVWIAIAVVLGRALGSRHAGAREL